jgi:hypothetical protein
MISLDAGFWGMKINLEEGSASFVEQRLERKHVFCPGYMGGH